MTEDPHAADFTIELSPPAESVPLSTSSEAVARRTREVFVLAAGFYLYALLVMAGFVGLAVFIAWLGNWAARGMGVCVMLPAICFLLGSTLLVLWSLIPRRRKFVARGPLLIMERQPRLQEVVVGMAESTAQPVPSAVYVMKDINASVTEKGGIVGMRKQRVLNLGLPVFSILNASQFRALLAHEFGHYYWGDTRLGPWIGRADQAIGNTMETLHQAGYTAWLNLVFFWYADMFHHVAHELMRKQEFLADQVAAQQAGAQTFVEALNLLHVGDDAFAAYWDGTVRPLIGLGVRVPVLDGFSRYVATPGVVASLARKATRHVEEERPWEYYTHPMLGERIGAVESMPRNISAAREDPPALTLLDRLDDLDVVLYEEIIGKEKADKLRPVPWENILAEAYLPMWRKIAEAYAPGLAGVTPESLPEKARNLSLFSTEMTNRSKKALNLDPSLRNPGTAIGSALALALQKAGWEFSIAPGEPVLARRGEATIEPFGVMGRLAANKLSPEEWREECAGAGILGMDLGAL